MEKNLGENEFSVWVPVQVKVKMKSKLYFEINLGDYW